MILTRCIFTPHRSWPDFAFNQIFPIAIIGATAAFCHFALESREIPLGKIIKQELGFSTSRSPSDLPTDKTRP